MLRPFCGLISSLAACGQLRSVRGVMARRSWTIVGMKCGMCTNCTAAMCSHQQPHSLWSIPLCDRSHILQILDNHRDEVWHVQFSHSGTMLASASKDTTALVWRVGSLGDPILMHTLAGHDKAVAFLTWSPDDSRILTCGADNEVGFVFIGSLSRHDCKWHKAPACFGRRPLAVIQCQSYLTEAAASSHAAPTMTWAL